MYSYVFICSYFHGVSYGLSLCSTTPLVSIFYHPCLGIVIFFSANIIVPTITIFYIVLFLSYDLLSVWEKGQAMDTCASPHSSLPFCLRCQDSFLHHFPSSQRIVFGRSARVDVLVSCSFIWSSLFYLERLWFMNNVSLHSTLLTFVASDEKPDDTWFGVSYMEYLLLLFTCCEDYPPLFSSVFQCLMLFLGTSVGMALWESLIFFNMYVCLSSYLKTSLTMTNMIKFMSSNSTPISNGLHSTTLAWRYISLF